MADQFVQLPTDAANTGRKVDTSELTVNSQIVERQRVCLGDPTTASGLAAVKATAPALTDPALVVALSPTSAVGHTVRRNVGATVLSIKSGPGTLFGFVVQNTTIAAAWLQVFDVATGSVALGTTAPDLEIQIAAAGQIVVMLGERGVAFGVAISIASTTGEMGATGSISGVHVFALFI